MTLTPTINETLKCLSSVITLTRRPDDDAVALGIVPPPPASGELGLCQYLSGHLSALNRSNEQQIERATNYVVTGT